MYDYPCAVSHWGEEERAAISRVLASDRFTMGAEVEAFEHEFAAYHNMRHAIMVNSGSSANLVAVAALFYKQENPLRRGDKVIVPALAWATTYAPLVQHALDLALADCDETWNMQPGLGSYQGASLAVSCPVLGNPVPEIMVPWALYHIQDCCESLGASIDGKLCGTFGLMNTFSFYHSHQLSAIEGGMILTDDEEMNALCRMLRDHGMTRWQKPSYFDAEYDFRIMGYNVRPLEMHAAIARAQLPKLKDFQEARRSNYENFYDECWSAKLPVTFPKANGVMNPFGLHFTVKDKETRARLVSALRNNGIDCRLPTGGSFLKHDYAKPWRGQKTPNADHIHDTGLFLGNAPYDISDKIERAVKVMRAVL